MVSAASKLVVERGEARLVFVFLSTVSGIAAMPMLLAGTFSGPHLLGTALFLVAVSFVAGIIARGLRYSRRWAYWSGSCLLLFLIGLLLLWLKHIIIDRAEIRQTGWAPTAVAIVIPLLLLPVFTLAFVRLIQKQK